MCGVRKQRIQNINKAYNPRNRKSGIAYFLRGAQLPEGQVPPGIIGFIWDGLHLTCVSRGVKKAVDTWNWSSREKPGREIQIWKF